MILRSGDVKNHKIRNNSRSNIDNKKLHYQSNQSRLELQSTDPGAR